MASGITSISNIVIYIFIYDIHIRMYSRRSGGLLITNSEIVRFLCECKTRICIISSVAERKA